MKPGSILLLAALACGTAVAASAELPDVVNARLETRPAARGLEKAFRALVQSQQAPAWFGYSVPLVPGDRHMCCSGCDGHDGQRGGAGGCKLEREGSYTMGSSEARRAALEGAREMWVVFRVAQGRVQKIRTFSDDCKLDGGGLPLIWLTDARAAESVALVSSFVEQNARDDDEGDTLSNGALTAIALTDDPAADAAFDRFTASSAPESLRGHAAFWLGEARGRHGLERLQALVRDDVSEHVREQAVFGLSISHEPQALAALIDAAHRGSAGVRGQALFWMAQKAGKRAGETITGAIENDPDTEVKKKAVFALSQMPPEEGVPLLIQVARTNRNREVRKQAMFWLGQSRDPRALGFIEDILTH